MMFCSSCIKLASINASKACLRCKGMVSHNISVICETCSNLTKQCSACLKIVQENKPRGCGCGGH